MKKGYIILSILLVVCISNGFTQTVIPNGSFEVWIDHGGYANPQHWDSDNKAANSIPLFGRDVVTEDPDCYQGHSAAKLETKNIAFMPIDVPGILTLGTLNLDVLGGTYSLTGGFPVEGRPTHLRGFYKYYPAGGDSCGIAIGFSRTVNGTRDSLAYGTFTEDERVDVWTPFSAWIRYDTAATPDSFNILIIGSAVEHPTAGTILFVDDLTLDYSTGFDEQDPGAGIHVYHDVETRELLVYYDFNKVERVRVKLYDLMGRVVFDSFSVQNQTGMIRVRYQGRPSGVYLLEVVHTTTRWAKRYFLAE